MTASERVGHGLAKVLGIKLDSPEHERDRVTRGESFISVDSSESFVEEAPTSIEYLQEFIPTGKQVVDYIVSLFPFISWIGFYNLQWLIGDLVAGELGPLAVTLSCLWPPRHEMMGTR
jgi:solute carrier family 26 (sodium-independent sulfate anion transporter), member 11